jgi:hypothetical protein
VGLSDSWIDPNGPAQGQGLPVAIGPMTLPVQKRKLRWGWLLVCALFGFAGGIAAGPTLNDQVFTLVEHASSLVGQQTQRFMRWFRPAPPVVAPVPEQRAAVTPVPRAAVAPAPPAVAVQPLAPPAKAIAEPAKIVVAEPPAARSPHAKGGTKTPAVAAASTGAKKVAKRHDPFETGADGASEPPAATPSRKAKPMVDESAATAKSGPAPRPAATKSSDPLDNLITDAVTETRPKGKKRETKDIDAMLKDVQKSDPAPAPKREEPAALPPLSPAEIAKAMAGVKTRGNACAQRFGQQGVAELKLTVGKNGKVTDVRVGGKLGNTPIAECISKAARAASFRPNAGLSFDYRIDVR